MYDRGLNQDMYDEEKLTSILKINNQGNVLYDQGLNHDTNQGCVIRLFLVAHLCSTKAGIYPEHSRF